MTFSADRHGSQSLRALRSRILTPSVSETSLTVRGFHAKDETSRDVLEKVGKSFLGGYSIIMSSPSTTIAESLLETVPLQFRGFAYEGAAMATGVLDALPFGGRGNFAALIAGRGDAHVYMAYVGLGWAMARLPRFRWPVATDLDPLLLWLVLDGYGFHQAYFHTQRYVHEQHRDAKLRWPSGFSEGYQLRAMDQGIGRALWFVGGADAGYVADIIDRFPAQRHADLYSGVALAATYAGGGNRYELRRFVERASAHRGVIAQASAFAAEARVRANLLVPHTAVTTEVLCGIDPVEAAALTRSLRPTSRVDTDVPAYEIWRQAVADEFTNLGM